MQRFDLAGIIAFGAGISGSAIALGVWNWSTG
jgi:hypothetical protein